MVFLPGCVLFASQLAGRYGGGCGSEWGICLRQTHTSRWNETCDDMLFLKTESPSFLFLPRTRLWGFLSLVDVDVDMEAARIHALPDEGFYISDFITEDEEDLLLQKALK